MKPRDSDSIRSLVLTCVSLVAFGVSGCREHSVASPVPQTAEQPVAPLPMQARVETDEEKSCREFVQNFYDWYVSKDVADECRVLTDWDRKHSENSIDTINTCKRAKEFHPVKGMSLELALEKNLKGHLDQEDAAQAKDPDEIVGLDGDPFLNEGNSGASYNYSANSARIESGGCYVRVNETYSNGNDGPVGQVYNSLIVELHKAGGRWRIANVHYRIDLQNGKPPVDQDLISELKSYGY